jgi:hypothetical protein
MNASTRKIWKQVLKETFQWFNQVDNFEVCNYKMFNKVSSYVMFFILNKGYT